MFRSFLMMSLFALAATLAAVACTAEIKNPNVTAVVSHEEMLDMSNFSSVETGSPLEVKGQFICTFILKTKMVGLEDPVTGASSTCGSFKTHTCTAQVGCIKFADDLNGLGTFYAALELDTSFEGVSVCKGVCAPRNLSWCGGDGVEKDGNPYLGRWECLPIVLVGADGVKTCELHAFAAPCDEGDVCTLDLEAEGSDYGRCHPPAECAVDADCDDGNACTVDDCDEAFQCLNVVDTAKACDDGDLCTIVDKCTAAGVCAGTGKVCDDGNSCTTDACDPATGDCPFESVPNGTLCSDESDCSLDDGCLAGVCTGSPLDCEDDNQCTTDACNEAAGECGHISVADTTVCDDADPCTTADQCAGGACDGTAVNCDDLNSCTTDACDSATGVCGHTDVADTTDCGATSQCVSGDCTSDELVCDTDGEGVCLEDVNDGSFTHHECEVAPGATLGVLVSKAICEFGCADAGGCLTPGGTEAACADLLDNDSDGTTDCADSDCTADAACAPAPPVCTPACAGKACGDDGCDGSCGACVGATPQCNTTDQCVECLNNTHCDAGDTCTNGSCVTPCVPACAGKECGSDGCGGSCGTCDAETETCSESNCFSALGIQAEAGVTLTFFDVFGVVQKTFTSDGTPEFGFDSAAPQGETGAITVSKNPATMSVCTCFNGKQTSCHTLSGGGAGCQL